MRPLSCDEQKSQVERWSELTTEELSELISLAGAWSRAHEYGDFTTADALRAELMDWGAWPPEHGWHPVFESSTHRFNRLRARVDD